MLKGIARRSNQRYVSPVLSTNSFRTNIFVIAALTLIAACSSCDGPPRPRVISSEYPSPNHRLDSWDDGHKTYHQRLDVAEEDCPGEFTDGQCWVKLDDQE